LANRQYIAEFTGTLLLVATIVGSGIMAENLAQGNTAVALLANAIATGSILYVLITLFGPISGAHFNPVVTMVMLMLNQLSASKSVLYILSQVFGGVLGAWMAHAMFDLPILQLSANVRAGLSIYFSEAIATFGLLLTILLGIRYKLEAIPTLVALYITSAYWFTSSTSFANPAVTIGRTLTDTFSGINYQNTFPFVSAQIIGAIAALIFYRFLVYESKR